MSVTLTQFGENNVKQPLNTYFDPMIVRNHPLVTARDDELQT
jgi:hypothetical protein